MEKSVFQNIYSIIIIAFCMGLLYGMSAHADIVTTDTDGLTTAQHLCEAGKTEGPKAIGGSHLVEQKVAEAEKAAAGKDLGGARPILVAQLKQSLIDIHDVEAKVIRCEKDDTDAKTIKGNLDAMSSELSGNIARLSKVN